MSDRVTIDLHQGVADVRLNRPEKHNAIDAGMFSALIESGLELAGNPEVRAVVLSGNGKSFCAGLDMASFAAMTGGGSADPGRGQSGATGDGNLLAAESDSPANRAQRAAWVWQEVPVPVIAALQGVVFGAGLQIALGADIRYASPDVRMSIMEIKWGLIPDMAISSTARHILAGDKFKELAFTGRILGGSDAKEAGLVTSLADDPLEAAQSMAREIAGRSPDAIRAFKKLVNDSWQVDAPASMRREAELQLAVMGSANQMEAVASNMEKRAPDFRDPEP